MKKSLLVLSFFIAILFSGCGYKPSSYYAKEQINGNVFVDLYVDLKDPKNAVLIKDAMNEILVHRLNAKLVDNRKDADTIMKLRLDSVSLSESSYDDEGYTKLYKAYVSVFVSYENAKAKNAFTVTGTHDFSLDNSATITDTKRFEAIKIAASKALEEVISKIAVYSFKK
ncbi:LPS assembly lipoprotein LptE [Malaciobacter mytili]|uniref:LPS assembly lipoprotein LptE n=1 Tax=Malaciobacter mytili TaxID=603050 RepID=UPI003A8405B5